MASTYSQVADLLVGDMVLGTAVDPQRYVDLAADEIDSKLGWRYVTPLVAAQDPPNNTFAALPRHERLLVNSIANRLASGRLILAQSIGGEDDRVHAYGQSLINLALSDLMLIANGGVDIGATVADRPVEEVNRGPVVINHDDESLIDGFEHLVLRGEPWVTIPGELP